MVAFPKLFTPFFLRSLRFLPHVSFLPLHSRPHARMQYLRISFRNGPCSTGVDHPEALNLIVLRSRNTHLCSSISPLACTQPHVDRQILFSRHTPDNP